MENQKIGDLSLGQAAKAVIWLAEDLKDLPMIKAHWEAISSLNHDVFASKLRRELGHLPDDSELTEIDAHQCASHDLLMMVEQENTLHEIVDEIIAEAKGEKALPYVVQMLQELDQSLLIVLACLYLLKGSLKIEKEKNGWTFKFEITKDDSGLRVLSRTILNGITRHKE